MNVVIEKSYESMSQKAAEMIAKQMNRKPDSLISFPAGSTPLGTFRYLTRMKKEGLVSFDRCKFVGLDEWIGMTVHDEGSCRFFLEQECFQPLNIQPEQICFFDGRSRQLDQECQRVDAFIQDHGGIDLMLVGVGMNGHIGLNEPGSSFESFSHVSELAEITKQTAQNYFPKPTLLKKGITLGMKHVSLARCVLVIVSGMRKAVILKKIIESDIAEQIPATVIKKHADAWLLCDEESASYINRDRQHE